MDTIFLFHKSMHDKKTGMAIAIPEVGYSLSWTDPGPERYLFVSGQVLIYDACQGSTRDRDNDEQPYLCQGPVAYK